jgi:hypothetical protein
MGLWSIRLWFCGAVAVIAAAVADPMLEFASNAGWFGPGNFTDHSNLDVLPALGFGLLCAALHVALRARAALARRRGVPQADLFQTSRRALDVTPAILLAIAFPLQLGVLCTMESLEQLAVAGHELGGSVWMGAPAGIAIAFHALVCLVVASIAFASVRSLAAVTVRLVQRFTVRRRSVSRLVLRTRARGAARHVYTPVLCRIGERAPPFLQA